MRTYYPPLPSYDKGYLKPASFGEDCCSSQKDERVCSRAPGHVADHAEHNEKGEQVARWPQ